MAKIHYYSIGLHNNAGMLFPKCYAGAKLLDVEKSRLKVTKDESQVTCKNCLKKMKV